MSAFLPIIIGLAIIALGLGILSILQRMARKEPVVVNVPPAPTPPVKFHRIGFAFNDPKTILNNAIDELERSNAGEIHLSIAHGNGKKMICLDLHIESLEE